MTDSKKPTTIRIKFAEQNSTIVDHVFSLILGGALLAGSFLGMRHLRDSAYHAGYQSGNNSAIEQIQK